VRGTRGEHLAGALVPGGDVTSARGLELRPCTIAAPGSGGQSAASPFAQRGGRTAVPRVAVPRVAVPRLVADDSGLPGAACGCHVRVRVRRKARSLSWHPRPCLLRAAARRGCCAQLCGRGAAHRAGLPAGVGRLTLPFACCPAAAEQSAAFGKVF